MNRKEQLLPKARTQRDPTDIPFLVPYGRGTKDVHKVLTDVASLSIARQMHSSRSWRFPQKPIFKVGRNLKQRLVRSSFLRRAPQEHGCHHCTNSACPLHNHMVLCRNIVSSSTGTQFPISNAWSCDSRNIIYVIRCRRCNKQGVGEADCAISRLPKYLTAARNTYRRLSAVENHFADTVHGPDDVEFCIIDGLPPNFSPVEACTHAERARMESVWIARLQTQFPFGLNIRKQPRFSFTGHSSAAVDWGNTEA